MQLTDPSIPVLDAFREAELDGYQPWPADKTPDPDRYEMIEIGWVLYYRERTACN